MNEPELPDPYCNPDSPVAISFDEITSAAYRIKSGIKNTECSKSEFLSAATGMEIYIKKEFQQATGSFKERGARYAMMRMPDDMKSRGVVAASAGNHAQACCFHGLSLGIPVTVVMPTTAPIMKIQKCRNYKGNVIVEGKNLAEAKRLALAYARDHGMMYLNGYDHPQVLAGQGTVGLEVWEQIPGLDAVIVPCGGGGLLAGICVAVKALDKNIQVIAVEPERAPCLTEAFKAGKPVEVKVESTLADGLAVAKIGVNSFESVKNILDKHVRVKEQYIALAILRLVEFEKSVVEGAGASSLAAVLQGEVPELKGKKVCLILSGGNIDTTVLGRVLERGLAADGRLVKVKVGISDRVGGVEDLSNTIGDLGVHIKDMVHERAWVVEDVFKVEVKVICECRDREHSMILRDTLANKYGTIYFNGQVYPDDGISTATAIFAGPPQTGVMPQSLETGRGQISTGTSQASAQIGAGPLPQATVSFHPAQVGDLSPFPQPGSFQPYLVQGSQHPSQQMGVSQHPSQVAGSLHPSQAACEPCGSVQGSQQIGGSINLSEKPSCGPCGSVQGSQQIGGSMNPSQQYGGSVHPSQQIGGSVHLSEKPSCGPCGSVQGSQQIGGSMHPSQQYGGSVHPSQQIGGSVHLSEKPSCGPCGSVQGSQQIGGSMHPSQQYGGSVHPSQQIGGSVHLSEKPSCGPCGSVQVPQQMGGSVHQSEQIYTSVQVPQQFAGYTQTSQQGSMHPSQQMGSTHPSQQAPRSMATSQQASTQSTQLGGSIHPSQGGQYPPPPLGDQAFSQVGTQLGSLNPSQQSNRPNEIGVQKQFSSCSCRKRSAPGDYKR